LPQKPPLVADPVIVALGYHADAIQTQVKVPHSAVTWAVNPDPGRGQFSSLQTALALVPADAEGFLFIPVDCPAVKLSTVERAGRAFKDRPPGTLLVIPRCGDRRGHPVFAARPLLDEFLALAPTAQARDVVHRHIPDTKYIDVDDAGILSDVDDPEAYSRLVEQTSRDGAPSGPGGVAQ